MTFDITSIPKIMRHHRWDNGARLMDLWFSRASAIAPSYGFPDTQTIRMNSWVLTFPRAKAVYDQIIRERIWVNTAAQRQIAVMLRRNGLLRSQLQSIEFGDLATPISMLDKDYVNQRVVNFGLSDMDDMTAALGNFAFRVVVSGGITPKSGSSRYVVTISEVGVYLRDSYDFGGTQFLGFWDDKKNSVSMLNPIAGFPVTNDDFRSWRVNMGKGGDFLVFSDLLRIKLTTPDSFEI